MYKTCVIVRCTKKISILLSNGKVTNFPHLVRVIASSIQCILHIHARAVLGSFSLDQMRPSKVNVVYLKCFYGNLTWTNFNDPITWNKAFFFNSCSLVPRTIKQVSYVLLQVKFFIRHGHSLLSFKIKINKPTEPIGYVGLVLKFSVEANNYLMNGMQKRTHSAIFYSFRCVCKTA